MTKSVEEAAAMSGQPRSFFSFMEILSELLIITENECEERTGKKSNADFRKYLVLKVTKLVRVINSTTAI